VGGGLAEDRLLDVVDVRDVADGGWEEEEVLGR
jgi:hypothetical protein